MLKFRLPLFGFAGSKARNHLRLGPLGEWNQSGGGGKVCSGSLGSAICVQGGHLPFLGPSFFRARLKATVLQHRRCALLLCYLGKSTIYIFGFDLRTFFHCIQSIDGCFLCPMM